MARASFRAEGPLGEAAVELEKEMAGYFSTPLHSHRRELYERYGGQEPREESVQAEVPNANQRATGDGAGNVNTTRELPVLEAGLHTSPLVLAD